MQRRIVSRLVTARAPLRDEAVWASLPVESGFYLADGSSPAPIKTAVQVCWDALHLYVRFHCEDKDIISEFSQRDEPLYNQEVVEMFLAPHDRCSYFEFNVSPRNVQFDSLVSNTLDGRGYAGYPEWDCAGLVTSVRRESEPRDDLSRTQAFGPWTAVMQIPFASLDTTGPAAGDTWYVNFFRIKRIPTDMYSCWSPTYSEPANFHIPKYFGHIDFES